MKTRLPYALFGVLATLVGVALGHLVAAPAAAQDVIRQADRQVWASSPVSGSVRGSGSGSILRDCS